MTMSELSKLNYVNVGPKGTFKPSGDPKLDSTPEDVDRIFEHLEKNNSKQLVLYMHGGLVDLATGMQTATRVTTHVTSKTKAHVVCFVWETGFMETIRQNFDTVRGSSFFQKILKKVIKVAGKQLGLDLLAEGIQSKGVAQLSDAEIEIELQREAPFEHYTSNEGKKSASVTTMEMAGQSDEMIDVVLAPEVEADMEEEIAADTELLDIAQSPKTPEEQKLMREVKVEEVAGQKGIFSAAALVKAAVAITVRVIRRHIQKRDHGFYPSIIEEILREFYVADFGSWLWGQMKQKAEDMWAKDDFSASKLEWHAGTYFLKKLTEHSKKHPDMTIDLVGHSAGSIVICNLFKAVKRDGYDLHFRNVIFMAPACRCDLFAESVATMTDRFDNFRMFTMSDAYECKDRLMPGVYTRSLLYLVSGALEDKGESYDQFIFGLQRHIDGRKPYENVDQLKSVYKFLETENAIVYSVTGDGSLEGLRSGSIQHGALDDDKEPTLDSIAYIINQ